MGKSLKLMVKHGKNSRSSTRSTHPHHRWRCKGRRRWWQARMSREARMRHQYTWRQWDALAIRIYKEIYQSIYQSIYPSICLSLSLSISLSLYLSIYLPLSLSIYLSIDLSIYLHKCIVYLIFKHGYTICIHIYVYIYIQVCKILTIL
jgi:hypothetical protein